MRYILLAMLAGCVFDEVPTVQIDLPPPTHTLCLDYPLADPPDVADPVGEYLNITVYGDDETPPQVSAVLATGELERLKSDLQAARTWMRQSMALVDRCRAELSE